ncbi:MAG: AAA family ATPase, partial [Candidatus Micrarchaeia archaeon]
MLSKKVRKVKRDVYEELDKSYLIVIYGLRGTGKTTLLAQKYFEGSTENKLALHGEHLNLAGYKIKDIIPSLKYILKEGYLFIDEITKLKNWAEEIKVLSDMYPKIKIIVTGSSAVNLQDARRILARRALFINLKPLTLNEFLKIKYNTKITAFDPFGEDPLTSAIKTELDAREKLGDINKVMLEYKKMNLPYLMESPESTLFDVLNRIIYEDIGGIASFTQDVLNKFNSLLNLLALSEKTSYSNLSKELEVGKETVINMVNYLIKANVIRAVYLYAKGKVKVRKEPKY